MGMDVALVTHRYTHQIRASARERERERERLGERIVNKEKKNLTLVRRYD